MGVTINTERVFPSVKIGRYPSSYFNVDQNGAVTLLGDSRVYKPFWVPTEGLKDPGVKPATLVDYGIGLAWEFTDATDDTIVGKIGVPSNADPTITPKFHFGWNAPTADPGDNSKQGRWQVEYLWRAPGEAMDAAAEGTVVNNYTASTIAKGLVVTEISLSNLTVGDTCLLFRIKRRADEAGDTLDGDNIHLFGVCLLLGINRLGEDL